MGQNQRSRGAGLLAFARNERAHPWTMALDGALVLGVLLGVGLSATQSLPPVPLAVFSAVLVGTIMHRIFVLMEEPEHPGDLGVDANEEPPSPAHAA